MNRPKKEARKRIVPVPFRTERLRYLLEEMDEGQEALFPSSIVKKNGQSVEWVSSASNINRQINQWIAKIDSDGRQYTSYCLRHSFKHYLHECGADSLDVLYLAGWYGADNALARQMKNYAVSGLETPEMLIRFNRAVVKALAFLEDVPSDNVLPFANKAK